MQKLIFWKGAFLLNKLGHFLLRKGEILMFKYERIANRKTAYLSDSLRDKLGQKK